jgi:hypothetical protein
MRSRPDQPAPALARGSGARKGTPFVGAETESEPEKHGNGQAGREHLEELGHGLVVDVGEVFAKAHLPETVLVKPQMPAGVLQVAGRSKTIGDMNPIDRRRPL